MPRAARTFAEEALAVKRGEKDTDKPEVRDAAARMSESQLRELGRSAPVRDLNKYGNKHA